VETWWPVLRFWILRSLLLLQICSSGDVSLTNTLPTNEYACPLGHLQRNSRNLLFPHARLVPKPMFSHFTQSTTVIAHRFAYFSHILVWFDMTLHTLPSTLMMVSQFDTSRCPKCAKHCNSLRSSNRIGEVQYHFPVSGATCIGLHRRRLQKENQVHLNRMWSIGGNRTVTETLDTTDGSWEKRCHMAKK
jgi:hypothetical protein